MFLTKKMDNFVILFKHIFHSQLKMRINSALGLRRSNNIPSTLDFSGAVSLPRGVQNSIEAFHRAVDPHHHTNLANLARF